MDHAHFILEVEMGCSHLLPTMETASAREHYVMGAESARIFNPIKPRIPMIIASNIITLLEGFHQTSSSISLLYSKWPFKIPA